MLQPQGDEEIQKRQGRMWDEAGSLQTVIAKVSDRILALERQLSPILRTLPAEATGGSPEPPREVVPDLVGQLRARVEDVQHLESHLASLQERLEI